MASDPCAPDLPVGFERFHRRSFLDYQLNRAHALGWVGADALHDAAAQVDRPADVPPVCDRLAAAAAEDGRLVEATGFERLGHFFTSPTDDEAFLRYRRFRERFAAACGGCGAERHEVPYDTAALPAYRLAATGPSRGTVLFHGGFDSLIEELYPVWQRVGAAGFDVVAFEGPGQGGARIVGGLTSDHAWERPVGVVLDHFGVDAAALVGFSMGGWWALRAAGREPRLHAVVAWPAVYDWLLLVPSPVRGLTRAMLRRRRFMRWSIRTRTRLSATLRQVVDQACYLAGDEDPLAAMDWFLGMHADALGSDRVTQDVLLLCGEHDAFQPPSLTRAQAEALTAARSTTVRTFTEAEHADQHCQMGNLGLACDVLTDWLADPGAPVGD